MTELVSGPAEQDLLDLLAEDPLDVPGVVARLTELQILLEAMPPLFGSNPVADFNRLYRTITANILDRLNAGLFADPVFLSLLDVQFAKRYFEALRLWGAGSPHTPEVWRVLFERMDGPDARPLPSAVAGVNAHINYDLAFAVVSTFDQLGSEPVDGQPQHADYLQVNDVFAEAIPGLRRGYLEDWQLCLDKINGRLDDWYQEQLVEITRDLAWRAAQRIWPRRDNAAEVARHRAELDRNATLLGKALLSPFCAFIQ
jgi:hypothetical protein